MIGQFIAFIAPVGAMGLLYVIGASFRFGANRKD